MDPLAPMGAMSPTWVGVAAPETDKVVVVPSVRCGLAVEGVYQAKGMHYGPWLRSKQYLNNLLPS